MGIHPYYSMEPALIRLTSDHHIAKTKGGFYAFILFELSAVFGSFDATSFFYLFTYLGFPDDSVVKNPPAK